MDNEAGSGAYRIRIGGTWSLDDFFEMPRVFSQVYAFHCAFLSADMGLEPDSAAFSPVAYPWRGGYSTIGFYNALSNDIPQQLRPTVKSIRYASPGWMELGLLVAAATQAGRVVDVFVQSAASINKLYGDIHKGLHDRKLLRIEAERQSLLLSKDKLDFALESAQRLSEALGFESLGELSTRTEDPLTSVKILLTYYRKVRTLAEYTIEGKAEFPTDNAGEE